MDRRLGSPRDKIAEAWYEYHEIYLANGKRLDSFCTKNGGSIISRKATYLDEITDATFQGYLREFKNKYAVGTKIKPSSKEGKKLIKKGYTRICGKRVLQIPDFNKSAKNLGLFQKMAAEEGVTIQFKPCPPL